ncbi:MAG: hypothetical protein JJ837_07870 [Prochlorococcus marinus XMU1428]|nr:hypothetical protein [Prochlorococcus marinus XMU1428]
MIYSQKNQLSEINDSLFPNDNLKNYDTSQYPFSRILKSIFNVNNLDDLHNEVNSLNDFNADLGKDSESHYHKIFYKEIKKNDSELRNVWELFLENEVIKHFSCENSIVVQKLPNIRIHIPKGLAVKRWHCDSDQDHKHPLGEINSVIPLTKMFDTNSIWRESSPGKGDFKPFNLKVGEIIYWNGNTCIHGNKTNLSSKTRISFDFRVFPRNEYNKYIANPDNIQNSTATMGTKFIVGAYYKEIFKK